MNGEEKSKLRSEVAAHSIWCFVKGTTDKMTEACRTCRDFGQRAERGIPVNIFLTCCRQRMVLGRACAEPVLVAVCVLPCYWRGGSSVLMTAPAAAPASADIRE